ncbi:unnamed protein product [Allacma fusca]|uniref:Uncharacterized protein n=1 Tax=Allacma fusca TaxID=39272 RepID=A0A8J2J4G1_9HEXA|nr:unnamed protein product [Allacma fusca]
MASSRIVGWMKQLKQWTLSWWITPSEMVVEFIPTDQIVKKFNFVVLLNMEGYRRERLLTDELMTEDEDDEDEEDEEFFEPVGQVEDWV